MPPPAPRAVHVRMASGFGSGSGKKFSFDAKDPVLLSAVAYAGAAPTVATTAETLKDLIPATAAKLSFLRSQLNGVVCFMHLQGKYKDQLAAAGYAAATQCQSHIICRLHEVRMGSPTSAKFEVMFLQHDGTGADPLKPGQALGHIEFLVAVYRNRGVAVPKLNTSQHSVLLQKSYYIPHGQSLQFAPIKLTETMPNMSVNKRKDDHKKEEKEEGNRAPKRQKKDDGSAAFTGGDELSSGDESDRGPEEVVVVATAAAAASSSSSSALLNMSLDSQPNDDDTSLASFGNLVPPSTPMADVQEPSTPAPLSSFGRQHDPMMPSFGSPAASTPSVRQGDSPYLLRDSPSRHTRRALPF